MLGVKISCHTNIDGFRGTDWPTEFWVLPRVGDRIQNKNGESLKVVSVTHSQDVGTPVISIELNR